MSNTAQACPRDNAVSGDPQTLAQTITLLMQAEAANTDTKARALYPDWGAEQIHDEVDFPFKERGVLVPGPAFFSS